jgi:ElaB/YqjD/DUF883 family membrane-anchored ribosome-binding protein
MTEEPDVLREQIRETQESLASKLSTLEDKVVSTVTNTTESVTDTVETVKEKVEDTIEAVKETVEATVESVKRTFDLEYQVRERPWLMMAGSCAAGFLAGRLLPGAAHSAGSYMSHLRGEGPPRARSVAAAETLSRPNGSTRAEQEGLIPRLTHQFHDELEQVKGLALGALFGLVRDWATQNLPGNLAPQIHEVIDNVTAKLGGTRIEGPVLDKVSTMWGARKEERQTTHV